MCVYVDDDETTWLGEGEHKARKEHKCDACRRQVQRGEHYRYWTGLAENAFVMWKMCAHCWAALHETSKITGCPVNWWWHNIFDLSPGAGEEGGFMRDALDDYGHLGAFRADPLAKLRIWHWARHGARGWTRPDGTLYPVPSLEIAS